MAKKSMLSKFISHLPVKFPGQQEDMAAPDNTRPYAASLKVIFFIVDWHRADIVSEVCVKEKVRFHFITKGRGTASSDILNLLGIGAVDKAVVICLEQTVGVPVLLKEVRKKINLNNPGTGIAFTIPLSAINDPVLLIFKQSIHKNEKIAADYPEGEGANMAKDYQHDLIMSIVNKGYTDELMNTAREAGASGGTVLNARGQAHEGAVKFFGVSVQDEKEIILILTTQEKKIPVMRAICEAHGLNNEAQGIVFSLPVDNVMGLNIE